MTLYEIQQRLLRRTKVGDCWEWIGSTKNGYGQINLTHRGRDRIRYAHRLMWITLHGKIPRGLCVLHVCDNPRCHRPAHLWLGSKRENSRDMVAKGRMRGGSWR